MDIVGWIFLGVGLYCLLGAAFNWEWFFRATWSRLIDGMAGRTAARIFYALLGALFVGLALSRLILAS